jgi:hypothetical protein
MTDASAGQNKNIENNPMQRKEAPGLRRSCCVASGAGQETGPQLISSHAKTPRGARRPGAMNSIRTVAGAKGAPVLNKAGGRCPLYRAWQTPLGHRGLSEMCQERTHAERCRTSPCGIATTIHPQTEASAAPVGRNVYNSARLTALFDKVGIDLLCGDNVCTAAGLVSV